MSNLPARNRVIYQSEALFISPDTTGHHLYYMPPKSVTDETDIDNCLVKGKAEGDIDIIFNACLGGTVADGDLSENTLLEDFKFRTFASKDEASGTMDGLHPVLQAAGFTGLSTDVLLLKVLDI